MNAPEQAEYIVQCIRDAGSMYEQDARSFLAGHDAHVRVEAQPAIEALVAKVQETVDDYAAGNWDSTKDEIRWLGDALAKYRGEVLAGEKAPDARQAARDEAADWLAAYPFPADTNAWAHGRTEGIAWAVSVLRNPNPTKPGPEAGDIR